MAGISLYFDTDNIISLAAAECNGFLKKRQNFPEKISQDSRKNDFFLDKSVIE